MGATTSQDTCELTGAALRGTVALQHSELLFDAVVQTFAADCGDHLQPQAAAGNNTWMGIAAIVAMSGDVNWSAFIGLPTETACQTVARLAGHPVRYDSVDMDDAVGRLGSTVARQVKATFERMDMWADVLLPAVCRLDDFRDFVRNSGTSEFRCFRSQMGQVWAGVIAGL